MSDQLKSNIRTWWPLIIGAIATAGVTAISERFGITIDTELAVLVTGTITTGLVYAAGRWLEKSRWASTRKLGGLIVGLGLVPPPTYPRPEDPAVTALRRTMPPRIS